MDGNFQVAEFVKRLETNCSRVQKKNFHKGEIITSYIARRNQLCILLSGSAELVRYDFNGNKTIVEHLSINDIFGEIFYTVTTSIPIVLNFSISSAGALVSVIIIDTLGRQPMVVK